MAALFDALITFVAPRFNFHIPGEAELVSTYLIFSSLLIQNLCELAETFCRH